MTEIMQFLGSPIAALCGLMLLIGYGLGFLSFVLRDAYASRLDISTDVGLLPPAKPGPEPRADDLGPWGPENANKPYRYWVRWTGPGGVTGTTCCALTVPIHSPAVLGWVIDGIAARMQSDTGAAGCPVRILSWQRFEDEPPHPGGSEDLPSDVEYGATNVVAYRRSA